MYSKHKLKFVIIIIFIIFCGFIFYKSIKSGVKDMFVNKIAQTKPLPSPMPFEQLTIPYLRNRNYSGKILDQKIINENANYTSYFATYESDGLKINGLLTKPKGEMPQGGWKAIVFVHGYIPPKQYQTLSNYASYVDYLAKNNFVVFKIDLRGHAQSEGVASGAYYSSDYVVDVLNARAALASSGYVNESSIGLWGHSMAGNVVFRSFVAMAPKIKSVVIFAGAVYTYSDFGQFGISDNSYRPPELESERAKRRRELFNTYGEFNPESNFWKTVAATNYLDGFVGNIQIHHAVDDDIVNIGYSRNLIDVLKNTKIAIQLFEYESGGHNLTGASFNLAFQRTLDFFNSTL